MKFIRPVAISNSKFVSSTVPETDYAAWSGATTYALADRVISTTTHRIYESVQAGNLNQNPTTDTGTWWIDIGPTNRWAMLDTSIGTATTAAAPWTMTLQPGAIDSLALLDVVDAASVQIVMTDGVDGEVYNQTYPLNESVPLVDWYSYFSDPIVPRSAFIVGNLPLYSNATLSLTFSGSADVGVGTLAVGTMVDIGGTQYGASIGIVDYSRKEVDVFGVVSVTERSYAKRIDATCLVRNDRLDYVASALAGVRATPCVWVGEDTQSYTSLLAYGFYKDWGLNIAYPNHSEFSISIEGLT